MPIVLKFMYMKVRQLQTFGKYLLGIVLTTRRRDATVLPSRDLGVSCWRTIHIFVWPSCEMLATHDVYTMATRGHHEVVLPSLHNQLTSCVLRVSLVYGSGIIV